MCGECVLAAVYSLFIKACLFMVYLTTPSLAVGDAAGSDSISGCFIPEFMCGNPVGIAVLLAEF
jgi:hypothetical protein